MHSYQASVAGPAGPDITLPTITVCSYDSPNPAVTTTVFNPSTKASTGAASPSPPSPHAAELISVLTTAKSHSDTALYQAALTVQKALEKHPGDYFTGLKTELNNLRKPAPSAQEQRDLTEEEEEYSRKHHDLLQQTIRNTVQNMGKTTTPPPTNPPTNPPLKRRTNDELHIAMNARMQPINGKRIRKPRLIHGAIAAVPAPKKSSKKRARETTRNNDSAALDEDEQPATKKRDTRAPSFSPEARFQPAPEIKKEPDVDGEGEVEEAGGAAGGKGEGEMKGKEKGKDPVRVAAAKLMWAKRKAKGTNGRYGGRPVARAKGRGEGE